MKLVKPVSATILISLAYGCSHPIEIVGEGDVLSATGTRNCHLEEFQAKKENCTKNLVQGEYNETYYAVPRSGWKFAQWINYCADAVNNECAFTIPADAVQKNWGTTVPALVAVFNRLPVTPPEPPTFPSVDQDGNVSFATAKVVNDQSVTSDSVSSSSDADYFKFTAGETAYYSVAVEFSIPNVSLYWYNDDANATLVGESRTSGATKQIIEGKQLEKGKTYYIGVQAISQQEIQNYKLTISRGEVIPTGPVVFNDGGSHLINYNISTGVRIENLTTVTVAPGVTIAGVNGIAMTVAQASRVIVDGGDIRGELSISASSVEMYDGTIDSVFLENTGIGIGREFRMEGGKIENFSTGAASEFEITGGYISRVSSSEGEGRISGGNFGSVSMSYDSSLSITAGHFEKEVVLWAPYARAIILGGTFESPFSVSGSASIEFSGALTLSEPELVYGLQYDYLVKISGILQDGSTIDSSINCDIGENGIPCEGVRLR